MRALIEGLGVSGGYYRIGKLDLIVHSTFDQWLGFINGNGEI
jgi:hypothetical protein